jgi:hypothetical protein
VAVVVGLVALALKAWAVREHQVREATAGHVFSMVVAHPVQALVVVEDQVLLVAIVLPLVLPALVGPVLPQPSRGLRLLAQVAVVAEPTTGLLARLRERVAQAVAVLAAQLSLLQHQVHPILVAVVAVVDLAVMPARAATAAAAWSSSAIR